MMVRMWKGGIYILKGTFFPLSRQACIMFMSFSKIALYSLPPALTPSTLFALLAPHVPRAHHFFADTRRHAANSDGVTGSGPAGLKGGGGTGRLVVFVR